MGLKTHSLLAVALGACHRPGSRNRNSVSRVHANNRRLRGRRFAPHCFTFCHGSSSVWARPEFTSWKAGGQSWESFKQWAVDKWSTEAELPLPTDKLPAPLLSLQALALGSRLTEICLCLMFTASLMKCGRCEQKHVKARGYSERPYFFLVARQYAVRRNILCTLHVGSVISCADVVPEVFFRLFFLLFVCFLVGFSRRDSSETSLNMCICRCQRRNMNQSVYMWAGAIGEIEVDDDRGKSNVSILIMALKH